MTYVENKMLTLLMIGQDRFYILTLNLFCLAGNTSDYDGMVNHLLRCYPTTKIICIGFSMGGNVVTKYLGEKKPLCQIIAGISACQV